MLKIVFRLSFALFAMLVSGCAGSTKNVITSPSETPFLPVSSATPMPSFTPLPTDSPTSALTPTMIPTLSVEQARARLLDLLANNGGCHLPCLWDIMPGISTYHDAEAVLAPLTSISGLTDFRPQGGAIFLVYTNGDLELYPIVDFNVNTQPNNQIVSRVGFDAEAHRPLAQGGYEDVFDSKFFDEKVGAYALSHVLSGQGAPSQVMIETAGGPLTRGGTGGFDILLLYPDQGILANYKTEMHLIGANVRGCPANAYIAMELYPPGHPDSFFEGLKQTDWAVKMTGYKPLEKVTSMSVEQFYDTFREPTDKCLETPAKLWPTPEP